MLVLLGILIALFAILVYFVMPNARRMEAFPCVLYAHRGLHGKVVPENSLPAFRKARDKGVGVELDVRLTKDHRLVVFHDEALKRMCGVDIKVRDLTYDELKKYRLYDTDEEIPLFSDVLNELDKTPVICEIKMEPESSFSEICMAVWEKIKGYPGFICIESFNPFVVQWFAKNQPDLIRGQLSMNFIKERGKISFWQALMLTHLVVNVFSRPDFIAYRYEDASFGYLLCRKLFKPLRVAWTVKTDEHRKRAEKLYDGVIFEEEVNSTIQSK